MSSVGRLTLPKFVTFWPVMPLIRVVGPLIMCSGKPKSFTKVPLLIILTEYISDIRDKFKHIEELDPSILAKLEGPEVVDQEMESSALVKCEIIEIIAELSTRKWTLEAVPSVSAPVPTPASASVKLPLPPILLDHFEGNEENPFGFFNFKKTFENAIAGMPNLTKAQKLIYLRSYLKGEALSLVENDEVDDAGYNAAFKLLSTHFLNIDEIVDRTLDQIFYLDKAKSLREVESLSKQLHAKVQDLKSLGYDFTQ